MGNPRRRRRRRCSLIQWQLAHWSKQSAVPPPVNDEVCVRVCVCVFTLNELKFNHHKFPIPLVVDGDEDDEDFHDTDKRVPSHQRAHSKTINFNHRPSID